MSPISCFIVRHPKPKRSISATATQQILLLSGHLAAPSKILLSFICFEVMGPKCTQEKLCKIQFLKSAAIVHLSKESC